MNWKGAFFIAGAGIIGGLIAYHSTASTGKRAQVTLMDAINHQQTSDMDYEHQPISRHNRAIVAKALNVLLEDCPELGDNFDSVDPKSVNVDVVEKNTHQLMKRYGTKTWPSYVEIDMRLKKNWDDLDYQLVHHFHDAPGAMVAYYIGGGATPGIMVAKGIRIIPEVGDYECGQQVTAKDREPFHSVVVSDPRMVILDSLN